MMETINRISKQVTLEVRSHLDEKIENESNFRKTNFKQNGKKIKIATEEDGSSSKTKIINFEDSP